MYIQPKIKRFQEGGQIAPEEMEGALEGEMPEENAPEAGGEQNPLIMLVQAAAQGLKNQDCQMMAQVCQGLLQLVQQSGGEEQQGEPVFKKGGVLLRRII